MTEEICWICRRTKKEILEQAEKDKMWDYIDEKHALIKISGMYDCDYTKHICQTCDYIIRRLTLDELKTLVDDERVKLKMEK